MHYLATSSDTAVTYVQLRLEEASSLGPPCGRSWDWIRMANVLRSNAAWCDTFFNPIKRQRQWCHFLSPVHAIERAIVSCLWEFHRATSPHLDIQLRPSDANPVCEGFRRRAPKQRMDSSFELHWRERARSLRLQPTTPQWGSDWAPSCW